MKMVVDSQESYPRFEFVSKTVYDAFFTRQIWGADDCCLVDIQSLVYAYMTKAEQEQLSKLTALDEIDRFVTELHILAVPGDDFDTWREKKLT